jgi:hypothetical protein
MEHLGLVMGRIKEVQQVVAGHEQRLGALDIKSAEHPAAVSTVCGGGGGAWAAAKGVEVRQEQKLHDQVKSLEARISRESSAISSVRTDVTAIRTALAKK